jgi:hypothetical protein
VVTEICAELTQRAESAIDETLAALPPDFPRALAESITGGLKVRLRMLEAGIAQPTAEHGVITFPGPDAACGSVAAGRCARS